MVPDKDIYKAIKSLEALVEVRESLATIVSLLEKIEDKLEDMKYIIGASAISK